MFVKKRMGSQRGSAISRNSQETSEIIPKSEKQKMFDKIESKFEIRCFQVIADKNWEKLEIISVEQLDSCKGKSPKGFFYLGVALYKMELTDQAIKAYQKSNELY